jgi:MFS transporter, MHS family, proline/betaine transporter
MISFGFLTVIISRLFFPADSEYASLLLTTATFEAGFLMRPLGGVSTPIAKAARLRCR